VKRLLALLLGGLGLRALLRRRATLAPATSPAGDLRAKLAASRATDPPPPAPEPDLAARRADVHERARRTIDELRD
jgi:hypothetical protein